MKKKKVKVNNISEKITESTKHSGYTVFIPESAKKKPKKVVKSKKPKVEKPYNAGTMSSAAFFGWLRSRLRKMSMQGWKPTQEVKKAAKVPYVGTNKMRRFSYVCGKCSIPVGDKECAVHHKIPAGSLKSFADLPGFCERLFTEAENLILLCDNCHNLEHLELKNQKENGK